jgi:hypothetical protein
VSGAEHETTPRRLLRGDRRRRGTSRRRHDDSLCRNARIGERAPHESGVRDDEIGELVFGGFPGVHPRAAVEDRTPAGRIGRTKPTVFFVEDRIQKLVMRIDLTKHASSAGALLRFERREAGVLMAVQDTRRSGETFGDFPVKVRFRPHPDAVLGTVAETQTAAGLQQHLAERNALHQRFEAVGYDTPPKQAR